MNDRKILRIVSEMLAEYLREDEEDKEDKPRVETGALDIAPVDPPKKETIDLPPVEQPVPQVQEAPVPQPTPLAQGLSELDVKNQEIERLKEELSKAQLNSFNFQPIGVTNG